MFELKTQRSCHAKYNLEYHLIIVTKYRKPCITEEIFEALRGQMERILEMNNGELEEMNYEADHIHALISLPPQVQLSGMINAYKTTGSRLVRKLFKEHLSKFYRKNVFWSRSYLVLSCGGAPVEVIKRYIREQDN